MEENIKQLESLIKSMNLNRMLNVTIFPEDKKAIENLIKGYRELEEKNKRYEKIYKEYGVDDLVRKIDDLEEFKKQVTEIESTNFIKYKNYIPKSKIKEKLEYWIEFGRYRDDIDEYTIIQVLQELMEDK